MSSPRPGRADLPRDLLSRLGQISPRAFSATAYRHIAPSRDPLSGEGARIQGGRWNPPESFPTIYLALSESTVDAEFERMAAKQGRHADDFLPREFVTVHVELAELVDLRQVEVQDALRVAVNDLSADDLTTTQAIGAAAHAYGFEGLLAPSATRIGDILAVFPERMHIAAVLEVIGRRLRA